MVTIVPEAEWRQRAAIHEARVRPWVEPRLTRRAAGQTDPVDDFLFTYYSFRPQQLLTWHPGLGTVCCSEGSQTLLARIGYREAQDGVTVDAAHFVGRSRSARWIDQLLRAIGERAPTFGCFGMHEWAMVYRIEPAEVRHSSWPLRLNPEEVARAVESTGTRCTHFDAFRFFTEAARPLNARQLTRDDQLTTDQPGCLHTGMDLYKWAYKLSPLTSSELVADCFEFAREIRTVDMQASPYDLSAAGYEAITVETPEGRAEYVERQRDFAARAIRLRRRLLEQVEVILTEFERINSRDAPDKQRPAAGRRRG